MDDEGTSSGNAGKINNLSELDTAIKRLERKRLLLEEEFKR